MNVDDVTECPHCGKKEYYEVITKLKKFGKTRCRSAQKVERLCAWCGYEFKVDLSLKKGSENPLSA